MSGQNSDMQMKTHRSKKMKIAKYKCDMCAEPCYLEVVGLEGHITPEYCPFRGTAAWQLVDEEKNEKKEVHTADTAGNG